MSQDDAWKVLSTGNRPEVILALDFDVTGRPQAGFADLTSNLATEYAVWLSLPPDAETGKGLDENAYLDRWLDVPRTAGTQIRAVFGYCVGAVYAAEIAERIAGWQSSRPELILFDPEPAVKLSLYSQFRNVLSLMTAIVPADRMERAYEAGRLAHETSGDMDTLAKSLITLFEELSDDALSRAGLDATSRRELTDTFFAFMTYLTTAGRFDPFPAWRTGTALSSASPASGLNAVRGYRPDDGEPLVAKEIRVEADHIDLLRSTDVAAKVTELLNA
jgi:hypothetical protein